MATDPEGERQGRVLGGVVRIVIGLAMCAYQVWLCILGLKGPNLAYFIGASFLFSPLMMGAWMIWTGSRSLDAGDKK